jgi:histidine triad (HIT) family protein
MEDCIFSKIISKEIPKEFEYEDDLAVAFPDIHPQAPVHLLIIPKQHIKSINDLEDGAAGEKIAGRLIQVAKKLAKEKGIDQDGYKLLFRTGNHGGQEVPHIHLHLIGGAKLTEGIGPIK